VILLLDVWGAAVRVTCDDPAVGEALARDFEYFAAGDDGRPALELLLERKEPGPWARGGLPLFPGPGYLALRKDGARLVRYERGAAALDERRAGRLRLACPRAERLHELAYLAILSRAGEALDESGWHRAHALGFAWNGEGALLLLPSGGGKTTLALRLLGLPQARLLSEDTPLVDERGRLRAFPLRLGLRPDADLTRIPERWRRPVERRRHGPKTAVDLPFFRESVAASAPARWLLIGSRRGGAPSLRRAGAAEAAAALGLGLVAGWGVAQMSEYMIRPSPAGAAALARIAAARCRAAWGLARRCERWLFELGDDPDRAVAALAAALEGGRLRPASAGRA